MPSPIGNFFVKTLLNSPLHPLLGRNIAVITVTGCKTGKSITTPVNTIWLEDALMVTSMRNRTWWRNLRGGCDATLHQAGKTFPVRTEVVEKTAQVVTWLEKYFTQYPGYTKYFGIDLGPDGKPFPQELERLAAERVIIRLFPGGKGDAHFE
jgi:deazaflavin-dependent oxidoreductase (nitroreductase family)